MSADAAPLRALFAAFERRDPVGIAAAMDEHVVWRVPGATKISGDHRGRPAALAYLKSIGELTKGTWRARLVDVLTGETFVAAVAHGSGEREGRRFDADYLLLAKTHDGRLVDVRLVPTDSAGFDRFWA